MTTVKTLDDIVFETAVQLGDLDGNKLGARLTRLANMIVDDFAFHVFPRSNESSVVVSDNLQAPIPNDCIEIRKAWRYVNVGGNAYVFQLGQGSPIDVDAKKVATKPPNSFGCPIPVPDASVKTNINSNYYITYRNTPVHYSRYYFGEVYDYPHSMFFGWWNADYQNGVINFSVGDSVEAGDTVIIKYKSSGLDGCLTVPKVASEVIRNRLLQLHWETTNPSKAQYFFQQFRIALDNYRDHRLDSISNDDLLDAMFRNFKTANY